MIRSKPRNGLTFTGERDGEGFVLGMVQEIRGERRVRMEMLDIETNAVRKREAMLQCVEGFAERHSVPFSRCPHLSILGK